MEIYSNKDSYPLSNKKEIEFTWSSNIKLILFLIIFIVCLGLFFYVRKESKETTNPPQITKIRFSALSTNVIAEAEVELDKRLRESNIKAFFYEARIQNDALYVFLNRDVWRDLSLGEKSDVLTNIVQACKSVPEEVSGIPMELLRQKPQIYIYDRDFKRELALWTREGAAIIN
ncbi:MAG: hypothetical protein WBD99_04170 [Thermodesulfobacteriota bacterium]